MSYHRLGHLPDFASTSFFAEAVDPYAQRFLPRGNLYSPYGWGPDTTIGMPMNYTHHIDYVREPVRVVGGRRVGNMYDEVGRPARGVMLGSYERGIFDDSSVVDGDMQQLGGLDGILAVL